MISNTNKRTIMKLITPSASCLYTASMILILVTHVVLGQGPPGSQTRSSVIQMELATPCYKILLDPIKGDLIVGCKNFIYRLDSTSLQESEKLSNGPVDDNENCPPPPAKCRHTALEKKDQENRILLINEDTKPYPTIITCGTAKQGMCFLIKYTNFDSYGFFGSPEHYVNYIGSRKHALAFFVKKGNQSVLMVGHEPDRRPKEFSQPLLSARRMDIAPSPQINYLFSSDDKRVNTFVDLHAEIKDRYLINLVYGFEYGKFVYFVSTQQASLRTAMYETRLGRVCLDDNTFRSYTEIQISCGTEDAADVFIFATAAHLGVVGSQDRNLLDNAVDESDQVLYVSFMQTAQNTNRVEKRTGSVVCAFPMKQMAQQFNTVVTDCFEGKDTSHLLEAIIGRGETTTCSKSGPMRPNFACGGSINNGYIGSIEPVEAKPLIRVRNEQVTALITYVDKEQTVAVIGTSDGKILKSLFNQTALYNETFNRDRRDAEIRPEPVMDKKGEFLYAATGNKIIKFPMKSCSIYSSCRSCIASRDPQDCGWCGDKCCSREEEPDISEQARKACSPVIDYFTPSKGPVQGGTQVTIHGDNFGNSQSDGARHDISVAGVACLVEYWQSKKITCRTRSSSSATEGRISVEIIDTSRATGPFEIRGRAESREIFSFTEPKIIEISPKYGPVIGGTPVIIRGVNLDMGSVREVLLLSQERNISCKENTTSADMLTCITGSYKFTPEDEKKPIIKKPFYVQFDNWKLTTDFQFELKSGPVIDLVRPNGAIKSGDTKIQVYGQNLESMKASDPRMNFTLENFQKTVPCTIENNTYMWCVSPNVPIELGLWESKKATMKLGMNVTDLPEEYQIRIFPDPDVLRFVNGEQKVYIEDPVVELSGSNFSIDYDWDIRVGPNHYPCVPFEKDMSWTKLKCKISFPAGFTPVVDEEFPVSWKLGLGGLGGDLGMIKFEHKPADTNSILMACLTGIVFVLFIGFIVLFIWFKRRKSEKSGFPSQVVHYTNDRLDRADNDYIDGITDRSSDIPLIIPRAPTAIDPAVIAALTDCSKLLAKEWLTLGDIVGKGHFGCVFRARLYKPDTDETIDVAVKTMQNTNVSRREIDQFIQEAMIMKDFDHPHVLTLIGLCFPDDGPPLVVIPFMANGDLRNYISDELNLPRVRELIGFGVDVAKGMEYLAAQKFVHRDLAARNCILDEKLSVKVADFGLSRDVYEQEYYRAESGGGLPIKWMAPECLESKKCTTKSDVWSFGVVMWEILTRGRPPYPEVGNWDMLAYLKDGRRLPQPDSCPEFLYDIMHRCWAEDPNERPTFSQLVQEIEANTGKLEARSAARKIGIHVTYVNVPRGNYYNSSDNSDDRPGVGTRISDGSSNAGESGFSSSSHRSTMPRKPAVVPVPADDDDGRERARL